jgi:DNA-binding CsgD family transcriptional regulator
MESGIGGDTLLLSEDAVRVFGLIAAGAPLADGDAEFVAELTTLGYVVINSEHGKLVALDPRHVSMRRLKQELAEAAERVSTLRALPDTTKDLLAQFEHSQLRAGEGAEYIHDVAVVNTRLDDVVGGAEWEILAAQPGGPRTREQLDRSMARDTAALDRGVVKRTLYRASVRDNPVTAEYARTMSHRVAGRPAEFATLTEPFERVIIVDRRTAFISNHLVADGPEHAAWQVTDQAVIAYMVAEFDEKWRRADPWKGEVRGRALDMMCGPGAGGVRTTARQREIMRDMVAGKDQRATAARLEVSPRTVSDEIKELKSLFDAESREQLAFKWAFSQDRLVGVNPAAGVEAAA